VNTTLQWLIVAPLVVVAAAFAVWCLLGPRLKVRVLSGLLAVLPQRDARPWARWRAAVMRRISRESAGGCAACSRR
jgi:hypothetical protein